MANQSLSRQQRGYASVQTVDTQTPVTLAGTDAFLYTKLQLDRHINEIKRTDITGFRTNAQSLKGRISGTWSVEANLIGSGTAGTVPDIDPILVSIFGQAGTVVATTSVTYAISDAISSFTLARYRTPSTSTQHLAVGCITKTAEFNIGQDLATIKASGDAVMVLDSDTFSVMTVQEKFGLASFPAEPGTRTLLGTACIGFRGALTMDSQTIGTLRNLSVKVSTGNDLIVDTFNTETAVGAMGDTRVIGCSFSLYDDDGTQTQDLKSKSWLQTPIAVSATVGNTAGNTWNFALSGLILKDLKYNDSTKRWSIDFGESESYGSTLSSNDALTLALT